MTSSCISSSDTRCLYGDIPHRAKASHFRRVFGFQVRTDEICMFEFLTEPHDHAMAW